MKELFPEELIQYEMIKAGILSEYEARQAQFKNSLGGYWAELENCMWAVQALRELKNNPILIAHLCNEVGAGHITSELRKWHQTKV